MLKGSSWTGIFCQCWVNFGNIEPAVSKLWQGGYESVLMPLLSQKWVNLGRVVGTMSAIPLGQHWIRIILSSGPAFGHQAWQNIQPSLNLHCHPMLGQWWLGCYEKSIFANIDPGPMSVCKQGGFRRSREFFRHHKYCIFAHAHSRSVISIMLAYLVQWAGRALLAWLWSFLLIMTHWSFTLQYTGYYTI